MVDFFKITSFFNFFGNRGLGNVVISEVDALMCVVLSKAEKHVPNGVLVGSTECVTL